MRRAITLLWLVAPSLFGGDITADQVNHALDEVEDRASAWTISADPTRRAFGLRMLAELASPQWAAARHRLLLDDDPLVRAAMMTGITRMGDPSREAADLLWCRIEEATDPADIWPIVKGLAAISPKISFARLARTMAPLHDKVSRTVYRDVRSFLDDADGDAYRMIEQEATDRTIKELLRVNNSSEMTSGLLVSMFDDARETEARLINDRHRLRSMLHGRDEAERRGAASRLLEMRDPEFLRWLDTRARQGDFFSGTDFQGNPKTLVSWPSVAPLLSAEAVENLLFGLRTNGKLLSTETYVPRLRELGKLPGRETIMEKTAGHEDALVVRAKFAYLTADADLLARTIEAGIDTLPWSKSAPHLFTPLERTVRRYACVALSLDSTARHRLFVVCRQAWETTRGRWRSAAHDLPDRTQARVGREASGLLFFLGLFATGPDLDLLFRAWLDEPGDPLRRLLLRGILNSPDPRAATVRRRLFRDGTPEMQEMARQALPFESVLDQPVGSMLPASFSAGRGEEPTYPELPLIRMLPGLGPSPGLLSEETAVRRFAKEVSMKSRKVLSQATRRQIVEAIFKRAGVAADEAIFDRRRTIRHLGWLVETDRSLGQVPLRFAAEPNALGDQGATMRAALRAQPSASHIVASPLSPAMEATLDELLAPSGPRSELRRRVDELVERIREHCDSPEPFCGLGYSEPERIPSVWDPGFRDLGLAAAPLLAKHLGDKEIRVRHAVATLLFRVFLDEQGPATLRRDATGDGLTVRESALRHLALLAWRDAGPLFVEALDDPAPRIRAAGLAGVDRLRLMESIPKVETMVLDPDMLVARTACAVLRHVHGPGSWRVLVPLLDLDARDQRRSAAISALAGFRRTEVVRAIVSRLPEIDIWENEILYSLTGATPYEVRSVDGRFGKVWARWWREWIEANGNRAPEDWLHDGVEAMVKRVRDPNGDWFIRRLRIFVGPALVARKPLEIVAWWAQVKETPFRELVWRGFREDASMSAIAPDFRLLLELFPKKAPAYLVERLPGAGGTLMDWIHNALVEVAGIDLGNPASVVSELRPKVLERWRSWATSP